MKKEIPISWPESSEARIGLAEAHRWLAESCEDLNRIDESEEHHKAAVATFDEVSVDEVTDEETHVRISIMLYYAIFLAERGMNPDEVQNYSAQALELGLARLRDDPESIPWKQLVAGSLSNCEWLGTDLTETWKRFENPGTAGQLFREVAEATKGDFESKVWFLRTLDFDNKVWVAGAQDEASRIARELIAHDPENLKWQRLAADVDLEIGDDLYHGGRYSQAAEFLAASVARYESLASGPESSLSLRTSYAYSLSTQGLNEGFVGNRERQDRANFAAVGEYRKLLEIDPENANLKGVASLALLRAGSPLDDSDPQKERLLEEAFSLAIEAEGESPKMGNASSAFYWAATPLAHLHRRKKNFSRALEVLDVVLAKNPESWIHLQVRGMTSLDAGQREDAKAAFSKGLDEIHGYLEVSEWSVRDYGEHIRDLTNLTNGLLDSDPALASDTLDLANRSIELGVASMPRIHEDYERIPATLSGINNVMRRLAEAEWNRKNSKAYREWMSRSARLRTEWAAKVKNPADRDTLLADLMGMVRGHANLSPAKAGGGCLLPDAAAEVLRVCETFGNPDEVFPHKVNLLPSAVSLDLAATLRHDGSPAAVPELERAVASILKTFAFTREIDSSAQQGGDALRAAVNLGESWGLADKTEPWFRTLLEWRRKICQSEAGRSRTPQPWTTLALNCEEFSRRLKDWGRPEKERLPLEQERVEALMTLHDRGDFEHDGKLINALLALGELQQRLGDNGAAEIHFRRILEVESAAADASTKQLEPWMRGRIAMAVERLGDAARKRKEWTEAEAFYRDCLVRWSTPETAPGNGVAAMDIAQRVKLHLIEVHEGAGKGGNEECRRFTEEIVAHLAPLKASGKLPTMLEGVLRAAEIRKTKAAAATGGGN